MPEKNILVLLNLRAEHARMLLNGIRSYSVESVPTCHAHFQSDGMLTPETLTAGRYDGVVGMVNSHSESQMLQESDLPYVNMSKAGLRRDEPVVQIDEDGLAKLAADHFLERGYTNLGYVYARAGWNVLDRGRAFQRHANELKKEDPEISLELCYLQNDPASERLKKFLHSLPKPAGVLVFNDALAVRVLNTAVEIGLTVPDELGVLGVDNDELLCCSCRPALSSIPLPNREIGFQAMAMIDRLTDGETLSEKQLLVAPQTLEPRSSTDLAACGDPGISKALRFIRDNAHRGIDVGDVMTGQTCSRPSFEKRFRAETGKSPLEMIRQHRIGSAKRLLANTDWSLWQIAERSGFASASHLCTSFRKLTGQTPGQFRANTRRH